MISKCILFNKPLEVGFGEIAVPEPEPGQVITRTLFSGVSTGTESRVLRGGEVSEFPLIPGYENIGQIVQVGADVSLSPGDIVYVGSSECTGGYVKCWGAHVEYALAKASNLIPVPKSVDPKSALYAKVGGIALHGVKRASVTAADVVAIVGLGLIGHLAAQIAKAFGATVIGVDMDEERLRIARNAGIDHVINAGHGDVESRVKDLSNGGVDVAIDVTGIADAVDGTARLVHDKPWAPPYPPSARVVLLGSYTEPVSFSYHPTLFGNEPNILPSRDSTLDDLKEMISLIAAGKVKPDLLPAAVAPVSRARQGYKDVLNKKVMRLIFDWSEEEK